MNELNCWQVGIRLTNPFDVMSQSKQNAHHNCWRKKSSSTSQAPTQFDLYTFTDQSSHYHTLILFIISPVSSAAISYSNKLHTIVSTISLSKYSVDTVCMCNMDEFREMDTTTWYGTKYDEYGNHRYTDREWIIVSVLEFSCYRLSSSIEYTYFSVSVVLV